MAATAPVSGQDVPPWLATIADPVRLHILRTLCDVTEATASELAMWGTASYQTLRRHLKALQALGVVEVRPGSCDGERSGRPAVRYRLSPQVRDSVRAVLAAFA